MLSVVFGWMMLDALPPFPSVEICQGRQTAKSGFGRYSGDSAQRLGPAVSEAEVKNES